MTKYENNFILFLEDFYGGYNPETGKFEKFELFEYQREIIRFMEDKNEVFIAKSRQMHFTALFSHYIVWNILTKKDFKICLFSNNLNNGTYILQVIKKIYNVVQTEKPLKDNIRELVLNNNSYVKICINENSLIGCDVDLIVFDEAAYCKCFEEVYKNYPIFCKKFIAYSSIKNNDLFYKLVKEKGINSHWTQHPKYSEGYDGKNYDTSEWYQEVKSIYNNQERVDAEYNLIPIEKEQKEIIINFRISEDLKEKIENKIYHINLKELKKINISTYIRFLLDKDLDN